MSVEISSRVIHVKDGSTYDSINALKGTDGYSPTASVTKSGDTATITIIDKNGTTTAQISDGSGDTSIIAENYDSTYVYYAGAYCIYEGKFYKCTEDILTPETFDPLKWEETTIGYELDVHQSAINDLAGNFANVYSNLVNAYDAASTYAVGDYCFYMGNIYRCTTAITTPEEWTAAHWTQVTIGDELSSTKADLSELSGEVDGKVDDVQVNGTSVVNQGVANVPLASLLTPGVVKVANPSNANGIELNTNNVLQIYSAQSADIKDGTATKKPIVPILQHAATFYGLAKVAGADMAQSSNPVGTYTDAAKKAIREMLGLPTYMEAEVIADITTTEDLTSVIIDTDTNGQSFALRDIKLMIKHGASTTGASDYISVACSAVKTDGNNYTMTFPTLRMHNANSGLLVYEYENAGGMGFKRAFNASNFNSSSNAIVGMAQEYMIRHIYRVDIYKYSASTSLIPSGTRILLWGIRV